jgi:hypothetical protein
MLQDRADALVHLWLAGGPEEDLIEAVERETPRRAALLTAMMSRRLDLHRIIELVHVLAGPPR